MFFFLSLLLIHTQKQKAKKNNEYVQEIKREENCEKKSKVYDKYSSKKEPVLFVDSVCVCVCGVFLEFH